MVIGAEIDIFVRVIAELGVGVDRDDVGCHFAVTEVDHVLLAVQAGVKALGRIEFAAVRRDKADGAGILAHCTSQIVHGLGIGRDDALVRGRDLHGARPDYNHGACVAGLGFVGVVECGVRLGGLLRRRLGLRRCGLPCRGTLRQRIRRYIRRGVRRGRCIRLRFAVQRGLHITERFAALLRAGAAVQNEHIVLFAGAGIIIESVQLLVPAHQGLPGRECRGIIFFKLRDERPVKEGFQ